MASKKMVKCPECHEQFDRNSYPSKKIGNRWYHLECVTAIQERNKETDYENPHEISLSSNGETADYRDLINYICKKYDLKKPTGQILKQIKQYKDEYEYTYKGMEIALRYFYDIEKQSVKDNTGIGILPYIYHRAERYYININTVRESIDGEEVEVRQYKPRDKNSFNSTKLIDMNQL